MTKRKRTLNREEKELWKRVADQTIPMNPAKRERLKIDSGSEPEEKQSARKTIERPPIEPFEIGGTRSNAAYQEKWNYKKTSTQAPLRMDDKTFGRLKRGKVRPEARIDLHGMTVAEAHPALIGFILNAHSSGKRLVLVITGKGRGSDPYSPVPERRGILKQQVPQWLRAAPLASIVLQVAEAHIRHGGSGAYYVYLKRNR